jgi:hypothetical protein
LFLWLLVLIFLIEVSRQMSADSFSDGFSATAPPTPAPAVGYDGDVTDQDFGDSELPPIILPNVYPHITYVIPPYMYFVWSSPNDFSSMPDFGFENIARWVCNNPDWHAYVWVCGEDSRALENSQLCEDCKEKFRAVTLPDYDKSNNYIDDMPLYPSELKRIHIVPVGKLLQELIKHHEFPPILLGEPPLLPFVAQLISYLVDNLKNNSGSFSDLVRYAAGFLFGGGYADCTDVTPGANSIQQVFAQHFNGGIFKQHQFLVDHLATKPKATVISEQLQHFKIGGADNVSYCVSNDAFFATRRNPLLLLFLHETVERYTFLIKGPGRELTKNEESFLNLMYLDYAYNGQNIWQIKARTLEFTGPEMMRKVLCKQTIQEQEKNPQNLYIMFNCTNIPVCLRPMRTAGYALTEPKQNTFLWLQTGVRKCGSLQDAIRRAADAIEFESKYLRVIRLDDYINEIIESRTIGIHAPPDEKTVATQLIAALEQRPIVFEKVQVVQLLFECIPVLEFYERHDLIEKTYSFCDHEDFVTTLRYVLHYFSWGNTDVILKHYNDPIEDKSFFERQLRMFVDRVEIGMRFLTIKLRYQLASGERISLNIFLDEDNEIVKLVKQGQEKVDLIFKLIGYRKVTDAGFKAVLGLLQDVYVQQQSLCAPKPV